MSSIWGSSTSGWPPFLYRHNHPLNLRQDSGSYINRLGFRPISQKNVDGSMPDDGYDIEGDLVADTVNEIDVWC